MSTTRDHKHLSLCLRDRQNATGRVLRLLHLPGQCEMAALAPSNSRLASRNPREVIRGDE